MPFNLQIGENQDHNVPEFYTNIHDMKAIEASHYPPNAHYLLVCADVVWPGDPEQELHERIFTILMQYSPILGHVVKNYPAHIVDEDLDIVLPAYEAFIEQNRAERP